LDISSDHSPVLFILLRHPGTLEQSLKLTTQKTNWVGHLNDEADVDSFDNSLEGVLVSAARAPTPQTVNTPCNQKKKDLQIEQLVFEKRRLRRECQFH